jgi:hypothetical protein
MALPVHSMQKTSPRPEKRLLDRRLAAPEEEKRRNQGVCKQDPLGGGGTAWALARRSAVASRTARRGVCFSAGLKAADGDNIIPRPDPDGEGAGSQPHDRVGAVIGVVETRDDATATQPDEGVAQQLVWQLGRQLGTGIKRRQGKNRSIQSFFKFFFKFHQQKIHLLTKIHWAGQLEYQRLPQPREEQCFLSAVHGGRGVQKVAPWTKSPRQHVCEAHP